MMSYDMTFHPQIDYRELHRSKRQMPIDDGQAFVYTPENRERLEAIAKRYPPEPAAADRRFCPRCISCSGSTATSRSARCSTWPT